ncbi:MAG: hypothetical protein ABI175_20160 [Polyangiales bacterium]
MLQRLRRPLSFLAAPLLLIAVVAVASAGDDAATKARGLLTQLESKQAAPALSGAQADAGPLADDSGEDDADATPPVPTSNPLVAAAMPIAEAHKALEKATQLRAAGDVARAELAEDLALEWAETAVALTSAVEDERTADEQGKLAIGAVTKADRARQLLEEAIARRGRLQATLDQLDQELATKAIDAGPPDGGKTAKKKPAGGGK